jgi:hypothetical protein
MKLETNESPQAMAAQPYRGGKRRLHERVLDLEE